MSLLLLWFAYLVLLIPVGVVLGDNNAGGLRGVNASNIFVSRDASPSIFRIITVGSILQKDDNSTIGFTTEETIVCIPLYAGREADDIFHIDLPHDIIESNMDDIDAGNLFVSISHTRIVEDSVVILDGAHILPVRDPRTTTRSVNPPAVGLKTVAVVLISTRDSTPSVDAKTLRNDLFSLDKVNLKTQFRACSFGQLDWELHNDKVLEIFVDQPISKFKSGTALVSAAQEVIRKRMRLDDVSQLADKTLMCLPPGTGNWIASSGVGHWRAQFNDGWCRSLTATMHELGHTIGLNHANEGGVAYGDSTGYMAAGHRATDWPRKCFNGQKHWQLGWYFRRQHSVLPNALEAGRLIKLATFVDYNRADYDEPVLVEVVDDIYLQYNRAKGFNIDTEEKQNQVTVTRKTSRGSDALAGLSAGEIYSELFFGESKRTLIIEACSAVTGRRGGDVMVISVAYGKSLCEEFMRNQAAEASAMNAVNGHLANVEDSSQPDNEPAMAGAFTQPTLGPTRFSVKVGPTHIVGPSRQVAPSPSPQANSGHARLPTPTSAPTIWTPKSFNQVSNFWYLLNSWQNQGPASPAQDEEISAKVNRGFTPTPDSETDAEADVINASEVGTSPNGPSITSVFDAGGSRPDRPRPSRNSGMQSIFSTRGGS